MSGAFAYRPEIDGLRALAMLAVVANHYAPGLMPLGDLGVDVFFVISGFVIAGAIAGRTGMPLGRFLLGFYARRARRLLPALVLCVAVTALMISFFAPHPEAYLKTGIFALLGVSNLWLWVQASDYFADSAALNPFTHTWSLGVEEQFYLLFPLLVWLGIRAAPQRWLWALVGLCGLSATAWVLAVPRAPVAAFYLPVFRFWEIGIGAALFFMLRSGGDGARLDCARLDWGYFDWARLDWTRRHGAGLKGACVLAIGLLMAGLVPVEREAALVAVVALTGAALALTGPGAAPHRVLGSAPARWLGRISYGLYLWHWPVMVLFGWTIGFDPGAFDPGRALLAFALALGLAQLSYAWVETPVRRAQWVGASDAPASGERAGGRTLLAGVGLSAMAVLALGLLLRAPDGALYLGRPADLLATGVRSLQTPYASRGGETWGGANWAGAACVLSSNREANALIDASSCTVGLPLAEATQRVLVVGDSFAAAFVQAFDLAPSTPDAGGRATGTRPARDGRAEQISTIVTASWGASMVPQVPNESPWAAASAAYWDRVVPRLVAGLAPGDRVMIVSDLSVFATGETGRDAALIGLAEGGLQALAGDLATRGIALSVLGPLPLARDAACTPQQGQAQWFAPFGPTCRFLDRTTTQARIAPMARMLAGLEREGVLRVVDLFEAFCEGPICDYLSAEGWLLYRDAHSHVSVRAARSVRPLIAAHLAGRADISDTAGPATRATWPREADRLRTEATGSGPADSALNGRATQAKAHAQSQARAQSQAQTLAQGRTGDHVQ